MTSHIVISREELYDQLHRAFDAGWSKGNPSPSVENLVGKLDARFVDWVNSRTVRVAHTLPSGWLPIDQAPKDGTWVLVAKPLTDPEMPWNFGVFRFSQGYWRNQNDDQAELYGKPPTHFLPLIQPE